MEAGGYLFGSAMVRKFRIGATVYEGSVVRSDDSNQIGEISLAGVNDASEAVGIALEAGTYAATAPTYVRVDFNPFMKVHGKVSAGTAKDTAFSTATNTQILCCTAASNVTVTDANASDLDYTGGYLIPLTGTYRGHIRVCSTQTDSTSCASTVQWPGNLAVGTYVLRTYGVGIQGVETVATTIDQYNNLLASNEALNGSLGEFVVYDVFVDDQSCAQSNTINIKNGTSPQVAMDCLFVDHIFGSIA